MEVEGSFRRCQRGLKLCGEPKRPNSALRMEGWRSYTFPVLLCLSRECFSPTGQRGQPALEDLSTF